MGVDRLRWASRTSNPLVGTLRCLRWVRLPPIPANNDRNPRWTAFQPSISASKGDSLPPARSNLQETVRSYLLACVVEGKSYATIDCYADKLKGFLWYASNYNLPDDVAAITTGHIREFLAYLRDSDHRFNSDHARTKRPLSSTSIQRYFRVLSRLFNWLIREEVLESTPLAKIRAPRAERKVISALDGVGVGELLNSFNNTFEGKRNQAIILVCVDCGLRLGELPPEDLVGTIDEFPLARVISFHPIGSVSDPPIWVIQA